MVVRSLLTIAASLSVSGCATAPSAPLTQAEGARLIGQWSLTSVGGRAASDAITLIFRADGTLGGVIRCNSLSGRYRIEASRLTFPDPAIVTTAGCPETWPSNDAVVEEAEAILFGNNPATISEDGRYLTINGRKTLKFKRD